MKGYVVLGEALVELGKSETGTFEKIDLGVKEFKKAYSLCTGQNLKTFED